MKIYLNGVAQSTSSASFGSYTAMENTSNSFIVGRRGTHTDYSKGSIDEAKVYSKELSATEVLKNYNNGKSAHSN